MDVVHEKSHQKKRQGKAGRRKARAVSKVAPSTDSRVALLLFTQLINRDGRAHS